MKDSDREAENMRILSSRPFFKDLKALKQSLTSPKNLSVLKPKPTPSRLLSNEKRHSFKEAKIPQIKLLGIDGQYPPVNKQLSA